MEGQCRPVRGEKQGCEGGRGEHRGDAERKGGGGRCAEGNVGWHTERCWPAKPPETEVRPQKGAHPILRNHLQKLTDLSANPGVHQTAPEISVQLCMIGWSRVPGEKMLSGKTPGSELGEQRETHDRKSQGGWMRGNHCLPGSVVTHPAKGNSPRDPQLLLTPSFTLMTWEWEILFETIYLCSNSKSQLDLDKEILYWLFHQGPLKHSSLHILLASFQMEIAHNFLKVYWSIADLQ